MGKNHRHKKKLKSEKAKTQITSKTKFLPKGQNVTNTAFKIKPIVLQQQIVEKDLNQILSKKKQTIPELIAKLKHYNEGIKTEACEELSDLIKRHSFESLLNYLAQIIQNGSFLMQDKERKVRRAAVKLIASLLENIPISKIATFFNFISTNLRCAMTNIDKNIQEDSLLLLDALLEFAPDLIADNFDKIFPDFLALISKLRNDSSTDRTLTLNLGSKLTSVKWRIKVLSRLYGVLNTMIKQFRNNLQDKDTNKIKSVLNDCTFIPLYNNIDHYETSCVNCLNYNAGSGAVTVRDILNLHVATLVPLLYETWLEVVPEKSLKKNTGENTILNEESAAIFSCIVNILHLLYEYSQISGLENEVFSCKETEKFLDYLLGNFPYGRNRNSSASEIKNLSKLFESKDDPRCVEENLTVAYLFLILKINLNAKSKGRIAQIANYINRCLLSPNYVTKSNLDVLVRVLNEVLLDNPKFWLKFGLNLNEITENCINKFESLHDDDYRDRFLEILTLYNASSKSTVHQQFLGNLPKFLCCPKVSSKLIDVVLKLVKEGHELVIDGIDRNFKDILANLAGVTITNTGGHDDLSKIKFVYIFFYLPKLQTYSDDIRLFVSTHPGLDVAKHLNNMLEVRSYL